MKDQTKMNWIEESRKQYNVNKLGRLIHAETMLREAETSYVYGINYGSIFCIHSAFTSYLIQRLGIHPKIKGKKVRIAGINKLLNKANFLSKSIKSEIREFSRIRGNLEHPKSQLEPFMADWEDDIKNGSPNLRMIEIENLSDGIWFDPEKTAKSGLLIYYKMCNEIYEYLTKKNNSQF